jgi:putative nucleotidyltransferase with HDIG domain
MVQQKFSPEDIYQAVKTFPALSAHAIQLIHLMSQTEYDIEEVVHIVRLDSGLTSHVLRVVNSPVYNLMKPVQSIERAIVILGEQIVVGIALRYIASHLFDKSLSGYESQKGELWRHDLRVALASQEISRFSNYEIASDLAFTSGLLHDIGKVVLSDFLNESSEYIVTKIQNGLFEDYVSAENALLGTNHSEIGYQMAKEWGLPGSLQMAIRYHHHPAKAPSPYNILVYIVHLGDILAMMEGWGTGSDTLQYTVDRRYTDFIPLTFDDLSDIMLRVEKEFSAIEHAFDQI